VRSCGEEFWLRSRRRGRSIPAAGCDDRANAGPRQKTRRPEGIRAKDRLASLLLSQRPLRVSSFVAPHHSAFSTKTGPHGILRQALSLQLLRLRHPDVTPTDCGFRNAECGLRKWVDSAAGRWRTGGSPFDSALRTRQAPQLFDPLTQLREDDGDQMVPLRMHVAEGRADEDTNCGRGVLDARSSSCLVKSP